ncbi:hypothetical protein H696_04849 [Fonticula alba]|uniref:Uncharacterized protein n=1 Tax=Fonticula alba TaxID=691883 RepID=A0A058Z4X7_FONAL|nr:hypothetical protein H696_04849 [Fonticula alba]KCV68557.1 hypothetical protein H696_04849 [Fonticula alba]|eukprot:XP_009496989.1 hypothetical protein H696_04849 [Fonticula alba]
MPADPSASASARELLTSAPATTRQRMLSASLGSLVTSLVVTPLDVAKIRLQARPATAAAAPPTPAPVSNMASASRMNPHVPPPGAGFSPLSPARLSLAAFSEATCTCALYLENFRLHGFPFSPPATPTPSMGVAGLSPGAPHSFARGFGIGAPCALFFGPSIPHAGAGTFFSFDHRWSGPTLAAGGSSANARSTTAAAAAAAPPGASHSRPFHAPYQQAPPPQFLRPSTSSPGTMTANPGAARLSFLAREFFPGVSPDTLARATPAGSGPGVHAATSRLGGLLAGASSLLAGDRRPGGAGPRPPGLMATLSDIARTEGLFALWRGLGASLIMAIPANVVYFAGYEALREQLQQGIRLSFPSHFSPAGGSPISGGAVAGLYTMAPFLAGSFARIIAATSIAPLDLVKTRLQHTPHATLRGTLQSTAASWRAAGGGLTGARRTFWAGLGPTLARDVPFSGIYWVGYETLRPVLVDHLLSIRRPGTDPLVGPLSDNSVILLSAFGAGFASGATAALLTTPFDVLKTRMQVAGGSPAAGSGAAGASRPGALALARSIVATEGPAALAAGSLPRVLRTAPACAIMIAAYEAGKRLFPSS